MAGRTLKFHRPGVARFVRGFVHHARRLARRPELPARSRRDSLLHQCRHSRVPVGDALIGVARAQERLLIEGPPDQLQADR